MDARARSLVVRAGSKHFMRFTAGRCDALSVDERAELFRCSIYELRPDACRWLVPGSGECERLIQLRRAEATR